MTKHTYVERPINYRDAVLHTWKLQPPKTSNDAPTVVILHGAGTADSSRSMGLAETCADTGLPVISLDFVGHGKTGGETKDLSLQRRTEQAMAVISHWTDPGDDLILCGFSMSGHTVLRLTELLGKRVRAISLLCPAIYAKAAEQAPFTSEFSAIIRQSGSWQDSPALEDAGRFAGRVHIMISSHDTVIPWGVVEALLSALRERSEEVRLELVTGVEHKLAQWLSERPGRCENIMQYLAAKSGV